MATIKTKHIELRTGEQLEVRNAHPSEAAALIQYVKTVSGESPFLTFSPAEFRVTVPEEEKMINTHLLAPNRIYILATIDQQIVGILNVSASHKARLQHKGDFGLTVLKQHWRKGIGRHLLETTLEWARESNIIRKLTLEVVVDNTGAFQLYQKLGFEIEGCLKRDTFIDGRFHDVYVMALFLD